MWVDASVDGCESTASISVKTSGTAVILEKVKSVDHRTQATLTRTVPLCSSVFSFTSSLVKQAFWTILLPARVCVNIVTVAGTVLFTSVTVRDHTHTHCAAGSDQIVDVDSEL